MREWDGLHRGGQLWGCLQAAELSSREQLYLRLRMPCLLMAERVKEKPEVNPLAALLPYIRQLFFYDWNYHIFKSIPHFRMTN